MKRAFTLVELVVVVAIILVLAAILYPALQRPHGGSERRAQCASNLKQIGLGVLQYAQDYDDKFPLVSRHGSRGWSQDLQPYLKSWELFQCPSGPRHAPKTSDYFLNSHLAGLSQVKLPSPSRSILSGDGPDDASLSSHLSALPPDATTNENSFAQRHIGRPNFLFADGHVKWLTPDKVSNNSPQKHTATFAVR